MTTVTRYDNPESYFLARRASDAEAGWVFVASGRPGVSILVHPEKDCSHRSCQYAGTVHRHVPTERERAQAQDYITRWLRDEFRRERDKAEVAELERMWRLTDGISRTR